MQRKPPFTTSYKLPTSAGPSYGSSAQRGVDNAVRKAERKKALLDQFAKNGITLEDLKKEYDLGYADGRVSVSGYNLRFFYGALALVLHDRFGVGAEEFEQIMDEMYERIDQEITTADILERAKAEAGVDVEELLAAPPHGN